MSDRGIPYPYRHMNGYGSHTFSLITAKNELFWVRFHLKTRQDPRSSVLLKTVLPLGGSISRRCREHAGELLSGSDVSIEWSRANTSASKID